MLLSTVSGQFVASKCLICESQNSGPVFTSFCTLTFGILLSNFISSGNNSFHLAKMKRKMKMHARRGKKNWSIYPVHLGSPIRIDSTQYVHNSMSSDTRNLGNSMNVRVIKSNVCFDVNSTLLISLSIACKMPNRVVDMVSKFDSHPISR